MTSPFDFLIGKTIIKAVRRGILHHDDHPFLDLVFSDGSKATIIADFGGYTGNSDNEYPRYIKIETEVQN